MAYTVTKLAKISGVSVRTLHWYDEVGLLKPAYYGDNGYRYYEEEQLLTLQQILFFRELGFELKQIKKLLKRGDFDRISALSSHREVLLKNLDRMRKLIKTIDKTIEHIKGSKKMKGQEFYYGFSKEQQAEYEKQIIERFGEVQMDETHKNAQNWTKEDWDHSKEEFHSICKKLVELMRSGKKPTSKEVQAEIRRHFVFLKQFWLPTKETYVAHGQFILESELKKAYEAFDSNLPKFINEGIQIFAKQELK